MEDIILGKYTAIKYSLLNHVILYAKLYIHKQNVAQRHIYFDNFYMYYEKIIETEKERYTFIDRKETFI
jgi:hypothetical protein